MKTDFALRSKDDLTNTVRSIGISTWNTLTAYISQLPYGRNQNREDLSLVLIEKKGTCSSKHALFKTLADLNEIPKVSLILGIYKMNEANTLGVDSPLSLNLISYIPEAHCYLSIDGKRHDYTSKNSRMKTIENDIIHEMEISPDQVSTFKVMYHQEFIRKWIDDDKSDLKFEEVWCIREECIASLAKREE